MSNLGDFNAGTSAGSAGTSEANGLDALAYLRSIYRDPLQPVSVRMRAAGMALPHESPKLGVSMNIPMSEEFAARLERAIARATEAYAPKIIEHQPTKVITPAPLGPVPDRRFRRV